MASSHFILVFECLFIAALAFRYWQYRNRYYACLMVSFILALIGDVFAVMLVDVLETDPQHPHALLSALQNGQTDPIDLSKPLMDYLEPIASYSKLQLGIFFAFSLAFGLASYLVYDLVVLFSLRTWIKSMSPAGGQVLMQLQRLDKIIVAYVVVFPLYQTIQIVALMVSMFSHMGALIWFFLGYLGSASAYIVVLLVMIKINKAVKEASAELHVSFKQQQFRMLFIYSMIAAFSTMCIFLGLTLLAVFGWFGRMAIALWPETFVDLDKDWGGYRHMGQDLENGVPMDDYSLGLSEEEEEGEETS
jgi:hypothetical protein